MVLKQIEIIYKNHKLIIIGAMIVGILYPFFTDFPVPFFNNPKYLDVGLLIAGMVLFWEIYGEKRFDQKPQPELSEMNATFSRNPQAYPVQNPRYPPVQYSQQPPPYPQPNNPQYYPPPNLQQQQPSLPRQPYSQAPQINQPTYDETQLLNDEQYNPPRQQRINPSQVNQKPQNRQSRFEQLEENLGSDENNGEEYIETELPKISDIVNKKSRLPPKIPIPKSIPPQKNRGTSRSSFNKFGY